MDRFLLERLKSWQSDSNRKPLILRGARQVGKTWLLQEFGKVVLTMSPMFALKTTPRCLAIRGLA